jgi:hypothetical protein
LFGDPGDKPPGTLAFRTLFIYWNGTLSELHKYLNESALHAWFARDNRALPIMRFVNQP